MEEVAKLFKKSNWTEIKWKPRLNRESREGWGVKNQEKNVNKSRESLPLHL